MIEDNTLGFTEQFPEKDILNMEQITGRGLVNEIYIVTTPDNKQILRVDPEEENLERFQKEKWCSEVALESNILTPRILKIGQRKDNHPYMIMEYIEGKDGDSTQEYSEEIWNTLGKYASILHTIPVSGFGGDMGKPGEFKDTWGRFLDYNISQLTSEDKAISLGVYSQEESTKIKMILEGLKENDFKLGLSHYDLAPKNTRIDKQGKVYLIDWGSASVLPTPSLDIAEILDESLEDTSDMFKAFLNGYGLNYEEYLNQKPQINQLNLLMYLDKLRWAIDRRPERINYFANEVKKKLLKVL